MKVDEVMIGDWVFIKDFSIKEFTNLKCYDYGKRRSNENIKRLSR